MCEEIDLEMCWHHNYYDHPLSGMALYNGEYVWFEALGEVEEDAPYGLYHLSDEDLTLVFNQHKDFQECVGYHTDHHPDVFKPFVMGNKEKFEWFYDTHTKWEKLNKPENLIREVEWHQFKYWGRPQC